MTLQDKEYVLTDGKKYIKRNFDGKYMVTPNMFVADTFTTQKDAENVKLNSITKSLSRTFYVAEIINGKVIRCDSPRPKKIERMDGDKTFYFVSDNNFVNTKWHKGFEGLLDLFDDANNRIHELSQEMSNIEAEITDIEHYIEFTSLNARDGYKLYRRLRELLRRRRYVKDEQRIVNTITKNQVAAEPIKRIIEALDTGKTRSYKPRILADLFIHGIDFEVDGE